MAGAPGVPEEWLVPSAVIGPVRLQVRRFLDSRDPERLRLSIERAWRSRPAPIMPSTHGAWSLITQADREWVETVGVRAAPGGSEGVRIRVRVEPRGSVRDTRWLGALVSPDAVEVNRVDHRDGARAMTTSVWSVEQTNGDVLGAIVDRARRRGLGTAGPSRDAGAQSSGAVFLAGEREELAANVSGDATRTFVVFHWSVRE
ncbi:MAG: hypothetical protein AB7P21_03130 [Lautropia sp.]